VQHAQLSWILRLQSQPALRQRRNLSAGFWKIVTINRFNQEAVACWSRTA